MRLAAPAHLLSDLHAFYEGIDTGETELEFVAGEGEGEPFYHFAFLAPPERFDELAGSSKVFDFDFWDARAFYFDDPAGNIVEIVAHQGIDELGLSELGLVGDTRAMAAELGRTLILAPPGRGWMPTGRPAERHPVDAELLGPADGEVELEGGLYRLGFRRRQA